MHESKSTALGSTSCFNFMHESKSTALSSTSCFRQRHASNTQSEPANDTYLITSSTATPAVGGGKNLPRPDDPTSSTAKCNVAGINGAHSGMHCGSCSKQTSLPMRRGLRGL